MLNRNKHFCHVTLVYESPGETATTVPPFISISLEVTKKFHSSSRQVDPDNILPQGTQLKFQSLLKSYDTVFGSNNHQFKLVVKLCLYALDVDKAIRVFIRSRQPANSGGYFRYQHHLLLLTFASRFIVS